MVHIIIKKNIYIALFFEITQSVCVYEYVCAFICVQYVRICIIYYMYIIIMINIYKALFLSVTVQIYINVYILINLI